VETQRKDGVGEPNTRLFWYGTFAYAMVVGLFSYLHFPSFLSLQADGWGNFLAGIFSPLAFLWLLYAALAQRAELQLQRDELRQNNESQRQQADALEAQARQFRAQADAEYSPIIVLATSGHHERGVLLELMNRGASVFDLRGNETVTFIAAQQSEAGPWHQAPGRGHTLPLWVSNCRMQVVVTGERDNDGNTDFVLDVRRYDLLRVRYRCKYVNPEQRVTVLERNVEDPPQ